jgi:hypothetical protein
MTDVTRVTGDDTNAARNTLADDAVLGAAESGSFGGPAAASISQIGADVAGEGPVTADAPVQPGLLVSSVEIAQARADEARRWAAQQKDVLSARVRENPVGSSAVVFGAGVLLGLLLNRR